jgi:Protein of unknown function (DUF3800)
LHSEGGRLQLCYVDEAGDTRSLTSATAIGTPVCVVLAIVLDQAALKNLTLEFLTLKRTTHPHLPVTTSLHKLAWVLPEIKGADLRRALRTGAPRRNRRHAIYFLDRFMALLEDYNVRIFGRLWIKSIGGKCDGVALYTSSMQAICSCFQQHLEELDQLGYVIADSRTPASNASVAHAVFTQKFKVEGDEYDRVLEMPTFGHSENHVGLQIADLLGSALLFPMATYRYCLGHVTNVHVDANFGHLVARYGTRMSALQYRFIDDDGRRRGGVTVDDRIGHRSGSLLFRV